MADPYTSVSISGYNANPPPDDGTSVATNKITWAGIKTKLADPLDTALIAVNSNVDAAFAKTISGGAVVSTGTSYPMGAADQGKMIVATASGITITTPDAATVHAPFMFMVANRSTGTITLAANAAGGQTVDGLTSQVMRPGSGCVVQTGGANWFTSGLSSAQISTFQPPYGFDMPINLGLSATVGSNLLTVSVKDQTGADPTAGSPVLIPFRNQNGTLGTPTWVSVTSALSINTNAVGATLGSTNGVPFRFWIVVFNNAGTPVLGLVNCSISTQVFVLSEFSYVSATGISAAATSPGLFYCPNGTTISGVPFRILGFLEYPGGLATAGTYNVGPTEVQLFGPGIKKPGDIVQTIYVTSSTTTNVVSTAKTATALTASISPTSAVNLTRISAYGTTVNNTGGSANGNPVIYQIFRGAAATAVGNYSASAQASSSASFAQPVACFGLDNAQTISTTAYTLYGFNGTGTNTNVFNGTTNLTGNVGCIIIDEIMG